MEEYDCTYLKLLRVIKGKHSLLGVRLNLDGLFLRIVKAKAKEEARVWCMLSIKLAV